MVLLHYRMFTLPCDVIYCYHCTCFRSSLFSDINASQGSVATLVRCGGIFNVNCIANFLTSQPVKELLKSADIWRSFRKVKGGRFFETQCIFTTLTNRHTATKGIKIWYVTNIISFLSKLRSFLKSILSKATSLTRPNIGDDTRSGQRSKCHGLDILVGGGHSFDSFAQFVARRITGILQHSN